MTTPPHPLAAFLAARLEADELVAREALDAQPNWPVVANAAAGSADAAAGWHVLRNGPARVLAEVAAKRELMDYALLLLKAWDDRSDGAYPDMNRRERHTANVILGHLALPHADHPDYRPEWAA